MRLRRRLAAALAGTVLAAGAGAVAAAPTAPGAASRAMGADAHQATLREAQEWLEQGRGAAAYGLLQPLELSLAGQVEFDTLFGHAALQAKQPSQAAFAFERCLAVQPTNGLCRLGIARAHISLEEATSARAELDILSQASPPPAVRDAITQYLDQLAGTETARQDTRLTSYLELGLGYDSNINNATTQQSFAVPAFGDLEFSLSRDGRRRESGFAQARYNISYSAPIAPQWRFLSEANVAATGNFETQRYNTLVSDLSLGLSRQAGKHLYMAKVQGQNYRLDDRDYRNLLGVLGQYSYAVTERSQLGLFVQGARLHYPQFDLRDANRYTLGASWMQGLANDRAVLYASLYGGSEDTIRHGAPETYSHGFTGMRLGGMLLATPRLQLEAGVGVEGRRYGGRDFLFQKARRDAYYDGYLGLNYAISRKLSLRPRYRYTHNDSNIALYDYQRHVISVNLRYELF